MCIYKILFKDIKRPPSIKMHLFTLCFMDIFLYMWALDISLQDSLLHFRTSLAYASLYSHGGTRPPLPAIRALGSALYDNPGTLLNGHLRQLTQQQLQQHRLNINNLKSTHLSSHEHSDSGLSAESHEYSPYNSERLVFVVAQTEYYISTEWQSVHWDHTLLFLYFLTVLHKIGKVLEIKYVDNNEICIVYHVCILCVWRKFFLK
jgi:hypothetical protein